MKIRRAWLVACGLVSTATPALSLRAQDSAVPVTVATYVGDLDIRRISQSAASRRVGDAGRLRQIQWQLSPAYQRRERWPQADSIVLDAKRSRNSSR